MRYVFALALIGTALTLTGCDDKAKTTNEPKVNVPEGVGEFKSLAPPGSPGGGGAKPAGPTAGSQ